jgi:multiple sugar transport system permease protein
VKDSKSKRRGEVSTLSLRLWEFTGTALVNLFIFIALVVCLSPLSYMLLTSLKTSAQLQDSQAPIWPSEPMSYTYAGKDYPVYHVPTETGLRSLALVKRGRQESGFIDPAQPEAGLLQWKGSWRALDRVYSPKVTLDNYTQLWKTVKYPRYFKNTFWLVGIGGLGVLFSSIAVAYGLSRFRIPGGKYLFILLVATIMIPQSILIVPSFVIFTRVLGWNGSFLPMIVPQFFGSAVYIFLLRQNFRSIPRDLDEAAMLDGAGPLRILISIILPQAIPSVTTVALLHFFNTWNELRVSSLFLGIRPDLQPLAFTASVNPTIGFTPEFLEAGTVILLAVPVIVLFLSQRLFMQDMVITGLEK